MQPALIIQKSAGGAAGPPQPSFSAAARTDRAGGVMSLVLRSLRVISGKYKAEVRALMGAGFRRNTHMCLSKAPVLLVTTALPRTAA